MNVDELLELKIRLLTEGATIPEGHSKGRKGGAGPAGGRYFLLPNGSTVGIPIRQGELAKRYGSAPLEPTDDPKFWLYDNEIKLELIPKPVLSGSTNSEGLPYDQIALLHGRDCLATTVYQSCRYWSTGDQCKFCTIPVSLKIGRTILEKTPEQIAEVVKAAEATAAQILLTTGTPDLDDVGCNRLIDIVKGIRKVSDIPIAVQFEPPKDHGLLDKLAEAGVNAVGIHLESADEKIREEMCPGKTNYGTTKLYRETWQYALQLFGRGNVSTYLLHGLGEDIETTLEFVAEIAKMGVLPIVAPVRPSPESNLATFTPTYVNKLDKSVDLYKKIGRILYSEGLNPKETTAGCSSCGGCTPIQDAYDWAAVQEG